MAKETTSTAKTELRKLRDPDIFKKLIGDRPDSSRRVVGLDLGTNCGFAFRDIDTGKDTPHPIVAGMWDLSIGPYDSGPLRHIRLKHFLSVAKPDLVMYEEVKYDPPGAKFMKPGAIIARISTSAEFLGGLKTTVSTWCEENAVPAQGIAIAKIKKHATGKGNAGKPAMIEACNEHFGTCLSPADYEKNGDDNIADAIWVCDIGVTMYSKGF